MNNGFSGIDLSKLPAPKVVEKLSFEAILAEWKADFLKRHPDASAVLDLESEPVVKLMETGAYREMLLRQRVNDGARAVMLAYAVGADLEHLAALTPTRRAVIDPGNPNAVPPVPPTLEPDDEFRRRVQMAPESFSVAGPEGAYVFFALTLPECRDASVTSPAPCEIRVTVLGRDGDGVPDQGLLDQVEAALSHRDVRPLTDQVTVQAAQIVDYAIAATLELYDGPDVSVVTEVARAAALEYTVSRHRLGDVVTLSGIYAALHRPGVRRVNLASPTADIVAQSHQAPFCTAINVEAAP